MKYAIITKNLCIDRERRLQMSVIHLKKEEFERKQEKNHNLLLEDIQKYQK